MVAGPMDDAPTLEELQAAADAAPDDAAAHHALGLALLRKMRWDDAEATFGRAVELEPASPLFLRDLGRARDAGGNPQTALRAYEKGLAAAREAGDADMEKELTQVVHRMKPFA